jgi:hypothetical protein
MVNRYEFKSPSLAASPLSASEYLHKNRNVTVLVCHSAFPANIWRSQFDAQAEAQSRDLPGSPGNTAVNILCRRDGDPIVCC